MARKPTRVKSSDRYEFLDGMRRLGLEALGRDILAAVEAARWSPASEEIDPYRARAWTGIAPGGFRFVVADFEIESQGFEGQRGADGTVVTGGRVIRLGHVLSRHAVDLARRQAEVI